MEAVFEDLSNSQTLKDKAYISLREMIITGKITPGSRLPEEELSKRMNISRAPIREALNMLEREGFATIIPRRGAIVSTVTPQLVSSIWEMRYLLEPYAARISMGLIPDSEIARIDRMVREVRDNPEDMELYVKCDLELHEMLCKYQENKYLNDYISTTVSHSLRVRYFAEYNEDYSTEAVHDVCKEHLAIMDALKLGDSEKLYSMVQKHIVNSRHRCESALNVREEN